MAATGGVRGGGRSGGAGGSKGAGGSGKAGAAKGASSFGKTEKTESLEGVSRHVSALGDAGPTDPVTQKVVQLSGDLNAGKITKEQATHQFIELVLKQNLKLQSDKLTKTIAETIRGDPEQSKTLDRIFLKGANASR